MHRVIGAIAVGAILTFMLATNVSAAAEEIELDCGADGTLTVLVNGNGQFSPGRLVDGGVVIPVAFENQHGTFTDNEGNVFEEFPPDVTKGNGNAGKGKDLIVCDFAVTFEDENGSGSFGGTVTAYVVGAK